MKTIVMDEKLFEFTANLLKIDGLQAIGMKEDEDNFVALYEKFNSARRKKKMTKIKGGNEK